MKLMNMRDALITKSIRGLDKITGIPAYDALKPKVTAFVTEIVDTLVKYVGDFDADAQHEEDLLHVIGGLGGGLSGILTQLELTQEDQERVIAAANAVFNAAIKEQLLQRIRQHAAHDSPVLDKQDLN